MEKELEIRIAKSKADIILELLYMGLVMYHENVEDRQEDIYDQYAEEFMKKYISQTENIPLQDITDNKVAALREKQIDATNRYIDDYDRGVYLAKLAERLTKKYFPLEPEGRTKAAFERYENEILRSLKFVGEDIVEIEAPFLNEKVDRFYDALMKVRKKN